jgi:hypothetical protein
VKARHLVWGTAVASGIAAACGHGLSRPEKFVTAATRQAALRRAQIWHPTNVGSLNLTQGPPGKAAFAPEEVVACDYDRERLGGNTPKFACTRDDHDHLKVRYGRNNGEVYASVAATRLLWALGYGADAVYPVQIVCKGCPPALHGDEPPSAGETRFDVAAVERKFPGEDIQTADKGPGWSWAELDEVDAAAGGAPLAQRDGLKLLAVLIQHTDNKAEQQRLVCLGDRRSDRDVDDCSDPFLMIHDVGQTFGAANMFNRATVGSVNLDRWSHTPVWKDAKRCIGNLAQSQTGTLMDPSISEAGRRFLSDLLAQLTDDQLHDLFAVARFDRKPQGGGSIDAWVDAFKHKRDEIAGVTCPF